MICNENLSYVIGVITTNWVISISMVYLNKYLMTNNEISIPAPFFITWFQCLVTSVIYSIAGYFGDRVSRINNSNNGGAGLYSKLNTVDLDTVINGVVNGNNKNSTSPTQPPSSFITQFPKTSYQPSIAIRILPLSLIFVGMVTFNNLCLSHVNVSFYNAARSLTIVFNIVLSWIILGVTSSPKTLCCLLVVIFGFYIGYQNEMTIISNTNLDVSSIEQQQFQEYHGTYFGILSSLFVSFNSIYIKKVLSVVDDNHWKLTFYNNINGAIILIPIVYYYEFDFIMLEHAEQLNDFYYWTLMILAGVLGFSIAIVTVLQIKATSPLCHNFLGTGKALIQSLLAFYVWKNEMTKVGVLSIVIVLGGSLLYTYVKMNESNNILMTGGYFKVSSSSNTKYGIVGTNSSDVESSIMSREQR